MNERKQKSKSLYHLFTGLLLVLKGIDKLSMHHPYIGSLILLLGLVIVAYFIYHVVKKKGSHVLHLMVHLFEGCALLFTSVIFFMEGKKYLPYVTLAAATGFYIAFFIMLLKDDHAPGKNIN